MTNTTKRVLITGSSGFVGSAIYSKFLENNWNIFTIGRNNKSDLYCDFSKPMDIVNLKLPFKKFDLCLHIAAANEVMCLQNSINAYNVNCCGTNALAELFKKIKVNQFFYISTFHVLGKENGCLNENTIPSPKNLYGLTHRISEMDLLMNDMNKYFNTTIIRLPNIIGIPHLWSNFNRWSLAQFDFCKQCNESKKIILNSNGEQARNWVNLEFIASRIYNLVHETKYEKIQHIVGKNLSIIQLAKIIAKNWEFNFNEKIEISFPSNTRQSNIKKDLNFSSLNIQNVNEDLELQKFVKAVGLHLKSIKRYG